MIKKIILCFVLLASVCGCSNSQSKNNYLSIDGGFIFDKENTTLNLINEDLEESETYLVVVYTVNNTTDENWEDDFFWSDQVTLTIDKNEYSEANLEFDSLAQEFIDICGYDTTYIKSILAKSSNQIVSIFNINQEVINEDTSFTLNIKFDDVTESAEINYSELVKTNNFDTIVTDISGIDYRDTLSFPKYIEYLCDVYQLIKTSYNCILTELYGYDSSQGDGISMLQTSKELWESSKNNSVSIISNGTTDYYAIGEKDYTLERINELFPDYYEDVKAIYDAYEIAFSLTELDGNKYNTNIEAINSITDELSRLITDFDVSVY